MSKLSHSNPAFEQVAVQCERCANWFDPKDASEEAWRVLDMIVCEDCSKDEMDDNDWFGMGA